MGIDYDGGMIVGLHYEDIENFDKVFNEWAEVQEEESDTCKYDFLEDHDLETMSPYFDANLEDCVIGFRISDIDLNPNDPEIMKDFSREINKIAEEFKSIFGVYPRLIGCQHIY